MANTIEIADTIVIGNSKIENVNLGNDTITLNKTDVMTTSSIDFNDLTHIIIDTGHAPTLSSIFELEDNVGMQCVYACNGFWDVGVKIPNPFGFTSAIDNEKIQKNNKMQPDKYVKNIVDKTTKMMNATKTSPFYDIAKKHYEHHLKQAREIYDSQNKTRTDLFDDLFQNVSEWALIPERIDNKIDEDIFKKFINEMSMNDVETCKYYREEYPKFCSSIEQIQDFSIDYSGEMMTYNERLKDAKKILKLTSYLDGVVCFKCGENTHPFEIVKKIKKSDSCYCSIFGIDKIQRVNCGKYNILILTYDAEHG